MVDALVVHVVLDMPAVVPHRCPGPASQKAMEIPLLQFFDKDSDMPVQTSAELPQLQFSVKCDSKVQFMDTVVFMRTARGDATGAVL